MAGKTKKEKILDNVKLLVYVIIGGITIGGTIIGVDHYFAKTSDIQSLEKSHAELRAEDSLNGERLDLAITDDQIFQQEQHIQQMKNLRVFEQRVEIPELTPMEKAALEKGEGRLEDLKIIKMDKIKRYEEQRSMKDDL